MDKKKIKIKVTVECNDVSDAEFFDYILQTGLLNSIPERMAEIKENYADYTFQVVYSKIEKE